MFVSHNAIAQLCNKNILFHDSNIEVISSLNIPEEYKKNNQNNFNILSTKIEKIKNTLSILNNSITTIVLDETSGVDGLFYPKDQHPCFKDNNTIVLNPNLLNSPQIINILTHEYFHYIHYQLNPLEKDWIKEGLAQFFEYQMNHQLNADQIMSSLTQSSYSLFAEFDIKEPSNEKYGTTFLFFKYLYDQCYSEIYPPNEFIKKFLVSTSSTKELKNSIDIFMNYSKSLSCESFEQVALNFSLARVINTQVIDQDANPYYLINSNSKMSIHQNFMTKFNQLKQQDQDLLVKLIYHYMPIILNSTDGLSLITDKKTFNLFHQNSFTIYHYKPMARQFVKEIDSNHGHLQINSDDLIILIKTQAQTNQ